MYEEALKGCSFDHRFVEGDLHNIVASSDFAIVASGTATLETAMLGTPLIIVYKANLLTYILYRLVRTIPFLGIVNVIAGKEVAPELLQADMTPDKIADRTIALLSDPAALAAMRADLAAVKRSLGDPGASMRAARAILPLLK
jgi:Lipid A disaccharide synthetase